MLPKKWHLSEKDIYVHVCTVKTATLACTCYLIGNSFGHLSDSSENRQRWHGIIPGLGSCFWKCEKTEL